MVTLSCTPPVPPESSDLRTNCAGTSVRSGPAREMPGLRTFGHCVVSELNGDRVCFRALLAGALQPSRLAWQVLSSDDQTCGARLERSVGQLRLCSPSCCHSAPSRRRQRRAGCRPTLHSASQRRQALPGCPSPGFRGPIACSPWRAGSTPARGGRREQQWHLRPELRPGVGPARLHPAVPVLRAAAEQWLNTIKIGVFSPGWGTLYAWNNQAAVITVL